MRKENNEHGVGEKDLVKLNLLGGVLAEGKNARRCWLGLLLGFRDGGGGNKTKLYLFLQ